MHDLNFIPENKDYLEEYEIINSDLLRRQIIMNVFNMPLFCFN